MRIEELGRAGEFDEVRGLFQAAGYTEASICQRLGLKKLGDFALDVKRRGPLPEAVQPVDVLLRLFLAGDYVEDALVQGLLGPQGAALLRAMELLRRDPDGRCHATVALYPIDGLLVASDRWSNPDGSRLDLPADAVYPALTPNTRVFLELLPRGGSDFLDLGSGTGIAALLAARQGAQRSWAGDIAERSSLFAEFNMRLNGISNVSVVTSDLYENFAGRTFDTIVAHPPYVPTLEPKWIFYSGGEDGERVTRGIVEGLPGHLRDGGLCCCQTLGNDRKGRPFERRLRDWLGAAGGEFDIALFVRRIVDPEDFAVRANAAEVRSAAEAALWRDLFRKLEVEGLVHCFFVIRRRSDAKQPFTVRRQAGPGFGRAEWEWLLRWETAAASDSLPRLILDSRLSASRRTDFLVLHRLTNAGWAPQSHQLQTDLPFRMECQAQPWMAHLIGLCDGASTGRRLFELLKENGVLAPDTDEAEFARAVAVLVSGGFVEVEGFRPPQAEG